MIKKGINRRDFLRLFGFGLAGAGALELLDLTTENKATKFLKEITIGFEGTVEAVSADYVCDGTDDDVQWQAALDALPASGGKLVALAGNYVFGATVSRAIDNVTIEGTGYGSYFAYNASTALFSIGSQTRWTFRDLRLDAGGITTASASDWIFENIYIGSLYYSKIGDYGDIAILDRTLSADGIYVGIVENGIAGGALAFGNCIYQSVTDDRWELAKADAEPTTKGRIGICVLAAAGDGNATKILIIGKVRADAVFPTFTKYAPVFISKDTAGALTQTAPSGAGEFIRCVGQAISADELWFNPDNMWWENI